MNESLLWLYIINATLLICHEIDSAYWREWELFKLPLGLTGFLVIHLAIVLGVLLGLVKITQGLFAGYVFSIMLSAAGILAFFIHMFFIIKGRHEFKKPISLFILTSTFLVSVPQVALTIYLMQM